MVSHFKLAFPLPKCIYTQNPSNYSYPKINSQTISHGPILSEFRSKSSGRFLQLLLEFRLLFTDLSRFLQLPFWSTVLCSANLWASFSKFWALFSKFCCSCEVEWTKLCNSIFSIRNRALLPSDLIIGALLPSSTDNRLPPQNEEPPIPCTQSLRRADLNWTSLQDNQKGSKREPDSVNQVRNYFGLTVCIFLQHASQHKTLWSATENCFDARRTHVTLVECIILRGSCFHGFLGAREIDLQIQAHCRRDCTGGANCPQGLQHQCSNNHIYDHI